MQNRQPIIIRREKIPYLAGVTSREYCAQGLYRVRYTVGDEVAGVCATRVNVHSSRELWRVTVAGWPLGRRFSSWQRAIDFGLEIRGKQKQRLVTAAGFAS